MSFYWKRCPTPAGNSNKATAGFNAVTEQRDMESYINDTRTAGGFIGNINLIKINGGKKLGSFTGIKRNGR